MSEKPPNHPESNAAKLFARVRSHDSKAMNESELSPTDALFGQLGRVIRFGLQIVVLVASVWALNRTWGTMPALGRLLNPYTGLWTAHRSRFEQTSGESLLSLPGLIAPVQIKVDRDQVKHIFALNDDDLYFAQGFVVATDRLWQMDFIARLASGRLSEMIGPKTIGVDRMFTKLGLPAAERDAGVLMMADPNTQRVLTAYANGVNAYIHTLTPETMPFEYRLLGFTPQAWKPEYAAALLKFMAYNLAGFSNDLALSRSFATLSPEDFKDLFSLSLRIPEPIAPRGTIWPAPNRPDPAVPKTVFHPNVDKIPLYPNPDPTNGSNNWAVMGKKSSTGLPILSDDVHLQLSLPALFYEMQLVSPTQNVYGATLPGSPGIILGFNRNLAWGVTNAGADVLDWYELRYRDARKSEYVFDGNWRPVISRDVQINVRGQEPVSVNIRSTHLGPIVYDDTDPAPIGLPQFTQLPKGLAMRWAVLEPSNELRTFLQLNHAATTAECRKALETFDSPGQNFVCADNHNDVGIWHMGRFPVRFKGQGRLIVDGTSSQYEWKGWIPRDELPFARNPDRGFVSSANQSPADETYPHYLGWPFENPFRSMRINELLREKKKFSPQDMVDMQGDTLSIPARTMLPALLKALKDSPVFHDFDQREKDAVAALEKWDFRFDENLIGASIYQAWWSEFTEELWSPRFPSRVNFMRPPPLRTMDLVVNEPDSKWFDNPTTAPKESLKDLAGSSFVQAILNLKAVTGTGSVENWKWTRYSPTSLSHLARIPGLSDTGLTAPGSNESIFANNGHHGPAWKMVVSLGDRPKAWGLYPGGQSGDPANPHYEEFFQAWAKNQMRPLLYLLTASEPDERLLRDWTLTPNTETRAALPPLATGAPSGPGPANMVNGKSAVKKSGKPAGNLGLARSGSGTPEIPDSLVTKKRHPKDKR